MNDQLVLKYTVSCSIRSFSGTILVSMGLHSVQNPTTLLTDWISAPVPFLGTLHANATHDRIDGPNLFLCAEFC